MLQKFKQNLSSRLEKFEVEQAYLQRKDNLAKIPERDDSAAANFGSDSSAGKEGLIKKEPILK